MDNLKSYIATVDELVEDENKIVTYKSLCQHLALTCNKAKLLLDLYAKNAEHGKISVTYALTGRTNSKISVGVYTENEIEAAKSKLDLVLSCHSYSVQKAKLKDTLPLYSADYDMTKNILYRCASFSSIKYTGSKQLSEDEIKQLKARTLNSSNNCVAEEDKKQSVVKSKIEGKNARINGEQKSLMQQFQTKGNKNICPKITPKPESENKLTSTLKEDSPKAVDKKHLTKEDKGVTLKQGTQNKKKSSKLPVGMQAFMTKGKSDLFKSTQSKLKPQSPSQPNDDLLLPPDVSNKVKESVNGKQESSKEQEVDKIKKEPAPDMEISPNLDKEVISTSDPTAKKESNKNKRETKKKSRANKSAEPSKKRKRIQMAFLSSSSSSESETEDNLNQIDVIPPSPPPVVKKVLAPKNPRKKRKLKSRTYFAADGSMLTEKVWEEESCSSDDDDDAITKTKENQSPTVAEEKPIFKKAVTKGKQSSLMGFFNKKT